MTALAQAFANWENAVTLVAGELRRRFWKTGAGVASRMEVEVSKITAVKP
jgi:hypothetical protein